MKQMIQNSRQRRAFDVVFLFAIKNRYKISLYKCTREMQHVVNPAPYRASYCSGVTNIWKDRIIQRDDALTCTPTMRLEQLSYKDDLTTRAYCDYNCGRYRSLIFVLLRCAVLNFIANTVKLALSVSHQNKWNTSCETLRKLMFQIFL